MPISTSADIFAPSSSSPATSSGAAIRGRSTETISTCFRPSHELTFGSFSIRGGRQEIQYASSRLVSIREGPNVRLAFDGVRVMQHVGEWQIDGFGLVPVRVSPGVFDDGPEPGQWFWGVYATGPILSRQIGIDAYYLGLLPSRLPRSSKRTARELRHTIGTRIWGEPAGFDYNLELVYQTGSFGPGTDQRLDGRLGHGLHDQAASHAAARRAPGERGERRQRSAQPRPSDVQSAVSPRFVLQPGQPDRPAQPRRRASGADTKADRGSRDHARLGLLLEREPRGRPVPALYDAAGTRRGETRLVTSAAKAPSSSNGEPTRHLGCSPRPIRTYLPVRFSDSPDSATTSTSSASGSASRSELLGRLIARGNQRERLRALPCLRPPADPRIAPPPEARCGARAPRLAGRLACRAAR